MRRKKRDQRDRRDLKRTAAARLTDIYAEREREQKKYLSFFPALCAFQIQKDQKKKFHSLAGNERTFFITGEIFAPCWKEDFLADLLADGAFAIASGWKVIADIFSVCFVCFVCCKFITPLYDASFFFSPNGGARFCHSKLSFCFIVQLTD